uniref:Kazal-like domain-containing protein n=1 Tax=Oncorhynchus tshawytscha TaxID=74940 RepID=A0AAZ3RK80_ONCTS
MAVMILFSTVRCTRDQLGNRIAQRRRYGAEEENSGLYRKPSCGDMGEILACPINLAHVYGTDGNTYPNECALCVQRQ